MKRKLQVLLPLTCSISLMAAFSSLAGVWKNGIGPDQNRWKYENEDGTYAQSEWRWIDGNQDGTSECYYFDEAGWLAVNTITPDGSQVNEKGEWVVGNQVQVKATGVNHSQATQNGSTTASSGYVPSGPGDILGEGAAITAWSKSNGQYIDDQGNAISGAQLRGVSVSKWQGNIDWAQVASDDIQFAMIRMVSYGYEGEITVDETFDRNMREAAANGIKTAPYIYLQTRTVEEAKQAAQYAVDTARKYSVSYPIAVDVESQYIMDLSVQELTDVVNAFCQVVAASGYTPIIYSDYWKFTNEMDTSQFAYDIWLARYGAGSEFANRTIWQPTDKGTVRGIDGNVCLEFAYKNYAAGPS